MTPSTDTSTRRRPHHVNAPQRPISAKVVPCEMTYARNMLTEVQNQKMPVVKRDRTPPLKRLIAEIMRDGRWRTVTDIHHRISPKRACVPQSVRQALSGMERDALIHSEYSNGTLTFRSTHEAQA